VLPELLEQHTETISEILKTYARLLYPEGKELKEEFIELTNVAVTHAHVAARDGKSAICGAGPAGCIREVWKEP